MGNVVPGFETSQRYGIGAQKNTPSEIIDKLNKEVNAALADTKTKAQLFDLGASHSSAFARTNQSQLIDQRHSLNGAGRIALPAD
jgi:tripartite-type tricarboxylate transporter receptor subunit TctC